MARHPVLLVQPGILTKARTHSTPSSLEALPLEVLHRLVESADIISRFNLCLCSSHLMSSILGHGYLDFSHTQFLESDHAVVLPAIHFEVHAPRRPSSLESTLKYWISKTPYFRCNYCAFSVRAYDQDSIHDDRLAGYQIMGHFAIEASSRGYFFPKRIAGLFAKGWGVMVRDYQRKLQHASFLTLKVPGLKEKLRDMSMNRLSTAARDGSTDTQIT